MQKHLRIILEEMCKRAKVNFAEIDFYFDSTWYSRHTWKDKDQNRFAKWLFNYLNKNKEARDEIMARPSKEKKVIEKTVDSFILNYGWKCK